MKRSLAAFGAALMLLVVAGPAALAHEHRTVGKYETTVGWLEEPAYAGFRNAVQFRIETTSEGSDDHPHEEDAADAAEGVDGAKLKVEVIFGKADGTQKLGPIELTPAFGIPGEYHSFLIPTRPGTYTFRIFGTMGKDKFDETYTSGDESFNDIRVASDVQFPEVDPSTGEMAEALKTASERVDGLESDLSIARPLGIGASVVAVVALLVALASGRRGKDAA